MKIDLDLGCRVDKIWSAPSWHHVTVRRSGAHYVTTEDSRLCLDETGMENLFNGATLVLIGEPLTDDQIVAFQKKRNSWAPGRPIPVSVWSKAELEAEVQRLRKQVKLLRDICHHNSINVKQWMNWLGYVQ